MDTTKFTEYKKLYDTALACFRYVVSGKFSKETVTEHYDRLVTIGKKLYGLSYELPPDVARWAGCNSRRTKPACTADPAGMGMMPYGFKKYRKQALATARERQGKVHHDWTPKEDDMLMKGEHDRLVRRGISYWQIMNRIHALGYALKWGRPAGNVR